MDTPDIQYNPLSQRYEVAAPHRFGDGPGPIGKMKVNLYSIDPSDLAEGSSIWRYDGTLIRYKDKFGISDGFNIVGSVVDLSSGVRIFHVSGGDCTDKAGIYQYTMSLDTLAVSKYLSNFIAHEKK